MLEHLARPGRLALFRSVLRAGPGGVSRDTLVRRLRTTGSALTFHLRALAEVGLIQIRISRGENGEGRMVHCSAAPEVLVDAVNALLQESDVAGPVEAVPPAACLWPTEPDDDRRLDEAPPARPDAR